MPEFEQPDIIFTHESDLDGFVSGCLLQRLAKALFNVDVPVEPLSSSPWGSLKRYPQKAWVCDLSFDAKLDRPGWMVVDHHTTDQTPSSAVLVHNLEHCAAKLCYDLLVEHGGGNEKLEKLVHLTNVADLYLADHPDFALSSDYARLVKTYHFRPLYRLIGPDLEQLVDHPLLELMKLKREVEDPIGLKWSQNHVEAISPKVGYVVTAIGDSNYIVHQLLQEPDCPYEALITFFKKPSGPVTASVRSQNGEALALARKLQGGGHPNAAGLTLPRSVTTFEAAAAYIKVILNPPKAPTEEASPRGTEDLFESAGF